MLPGWCRCCLSPPVINVSTDGGGGRWFVSVPYAPSPLNFDLAGGGWLLAGTNALPPCLALGHDTNGEGGVLFLLWLTCLQKFMAVPVEMHKCCSYLRWPAEEY